MMTNLCYAGDHVDILGRSSLNDLILRIAGGQGHLIENNFVSRIKEYADRVKIYEEEEDQGLLSQIKGIVGQMDGTSSSS